MVLSVFPKATVYVADNLFILMLKYSSFYAYPTPNHMYIYLYIIPKVSHNSDIYM